MEILLEPTSNKIMVASDMLIDFQIKFSISIGETVTHWFTLIVLSALRRSDNENMLSLINLILMSILTDLQVTPTKPRRITKPYSSHRFIANCFNARNLKMEVKDAIRRILGFGIRCIDYLYNQGCWVLLGVSGGSHGEWCGVVKMAGSWGIRLLAILVLVVSKDFHKLTNLTVDECFAFNVSLRMFTRSIIIQRHKEDLQLGVKSYQKKLNFKKPDTYKKDLKCKEAYTAYSNPRGFFYQNKDKLNRLMRIDELHKFSDGMLNDVRITLDDRLKGIRMKYLPQTIWRRSDKERAVEMIQAIDKQLKTRRIMRSLKKFVGGRLYEGDFRMLQRTI
uniref:Uncharacterized protein n=1 Tax=Tanacetum cinerariifolium TaxID=118510 RepID=A0A699GPT8_TANCI|nr:hypothetical protein [Tanacetum cinerariifolium]